MGGLRPGFVAGGGKDEKIESALYARISQQTFDEAVQENMDDLEMGPDEALQDAIEQFTSQGINLSNIVKRVPGADPEEDPEPIKLSRKLVEQLGELDNEASEEIMFGSGMMRLTFVTGEAQAAHAIGETAAALKKELQKHEDATTLAGANGAVDSLVSAALSLLRTEDAAPLVHVLECLTVLLMDAENRERLGIRGCAALCIVARTHASNGAQLRACFQAMRATMLVHEQHRQTLVKSGCVLKLAIDAMREHGKEKGWKEPGALLAACGVVRATTLADDARARTSKGHEHAKAAVDLGALPLLLDAARSSLASSPGPLSELLATLSRLTVTDQICQQLAKMDALRLAITELANHVMDAQVAKQACFFLANISGNDKCKEQIREGHGHIAIVQAMLLHSNVGTMQVDAVSALGNMALRMPENCTAIAEAGGIPAIVHALGQHINMPRMQSKACLAIRNLVGRNEELRQPILDAGAEASIRAVMNAHTDDYMHNLAKAALRDLHCNVQLGVVFTGEVGEAKTLEQGDMNGENHWDKFLETPEAQEAARAEFAALGLEMEND
eukprot:scaffold288827_cov32-Tisochrysis_lutea.AAC.2